MCLFAIVPKLGKISKTTSMNGSQIENNNINLVFYRDIASIEDGKYYNSLNKAKDKKLEKDFAKEIQYNSRVAMDKYRWFARASYLELFSFVMMGALFIIA